MPNQLAAFVSNGTSSQAVERVPRITPFPLRLRALIARAPSIVPYQIPARARRARQMHDCARFCGLSFVELGLSPGKTSMRVPCWCGRVCRRSTRVSVTHPAGPPMGPPRPGAGLPPGGPAPRRVESTGPSRADRVRQSLRSLSSQQTSTTHNSRLSANGSVIFPKRFLADSVSVQNQVVGIVCESRKNTSPCPFGSNMIKESGNPRNPVVRPCGVRRARD